MPAAWFWPAVYAWVVALGIALIAWVVSGDRARRKPAANSDSPEGDSRA